MAKMCPASGCKEHKGLCIHEKLMLGMMVVAVIAGALLLALR